MNLISYTGLCLVAFSCALIASANQQQHEQSLKQNVSEEMHLITKSLEDLLSELAIIKREANGRLINVKNRASTTDQERIRQTKVSRFVLSRVAELELESLSMREELSKLFQLPSPSGNNNKPSVYSAPAELKQEDHDFDEPLTTTTTKEATTTTTTSSSNEGMPAVSTTTLKPEEEAAKIGFDIEALKKLGEEIGKRLDQFGKDAAKNLGELLDGVKLVFREPKPGAELEAELEARQQQNPESLRGVHEQVIKLVDNMVQNYLGNVRRTIQRMTNFIDNRRQALTSSQPRESPASALANNADRLVVVRQQQHQDPVTQVTGQMVDGFASIRKSLLNRIQIVSKRMHEFNMQWTRAIGKQQSPLLDRIPPRGVELWRDFWDTVRKQVRRINQEFWQLSQDMGRMLTGLRLPSRQNQPSQPPLPSPSDNGLDDGTAPQLFYSASDELINKRFQEFYDKMSVALGEEQQKMDSINKIAHNEPTTSNNKYDQKNLIDEQDDEVTKEELNRNVALRQQIQQEINIFSSIFDIMHTFIQRLRESATNAVRDVMRPGASNNNDNNPVTPGPSVKPEVDKVLAETIESQRNINSQAKPVLLPNNRPTQNPQ